MATRNEYLENAMFDAFVKTLEPEEAWYEYSWCEHRPVYGTKRNWWGRKREVLLTEERVNKSTGMRRLKYRVENLSLVFEQPESFQAQADTYDLLLNMYAKEDDAVPFVSNACVAHLRTGETYALTAMPIVGIGEVQ